MKKQADFVTPRYLNYRSASRYMGISEASIRRYKDSGELPFIKTSGNIHFDSQDIDSFMAKHKVSNKKEPLPKEDSCDVDIDHELGQLLGV